LTIDNFNSVKIATGSSTLRNDGSFNLTDKLTNLEDRIKNLESVPIATPSSSPLTLAQQLLASGEAHVASPSSNSQLSIVNSQLNLTPPDILYATGSATLANLKVTSEATISGMLTAYQAIIQDNFKVFGFSTFGKTSIAGDVNIDGSLSIEHGSELNVIGTLFIQKSPLASKVDIFNGKIAVDSSGNITTSGEVTASKVKTNSLTIFNAPVASSSATLAATIGSGVINANSTTVTIQAASVRQNSKIFITPTTTTDKVLSVINIKDGQSFDISLLNPVSQDIKFSWWIIGTE